MQELIQQVAENLGIDSEQAESAVGVLLSLVQSNGDDSKVGELFDQLPGAGDLAAQHGGSEGGGGLLGMVGGALGGSIGGPLEALGRLKETGLDMDQMKTLGQTVLGYAKENANEEHVHDVAGSIPGLKDYL